MAHTVQHKTQVYPSSFVTWNFKYSLCYYVIIIIIIVIIITIIIV